MAYIGRNPAIGTQKVLDSLESQFNGSLTTFDLRYNTNTIYPPIASALIVSLGGVLQEPGVAYTVASDTITFASAPPAGTDCWILLYTEFGAMAGGSANFTVSNNLTIGNELHGPANFVIDPATIGDNTGTVEIKGNLTVQGTQTTVNSTTVDLDHLSLGDNERANFGTGDDLQIYHNGSNSFVDNTFGHLNFRNFADNSDINFYTDDGSGGTDLYISCDGSAERVKLYQGGSVKLSTQSYGIDVTGSVNANTGGGAAILGSHLDLGDNQKARFGAGQDLQIWHDSNNSYIKDAGTGNLIINATNLNVKNAANNATYFTATDGGAFTAYHNNVYKFQTKSDGVNVVGALKVNNIASLDSTTLSLGLEGGANGFINTQESLYVNIDSNNNETGKRFEIRHGATDASGTQLFTVLDSGNVGIGQASPLSKLQIENAGEQLRLTYPSIASYIHEVKSNGDYVIDRDGTERLRITSDGGIKIDDGSNSTNQKLALNSDVQSDNIVTILQNGASNFGDNASVVSIDSVLNYSGSTTFTNNRTHTGLNLDFVHNNTGHSATSGQRLSTRGAIIDLDHNEGVYNTIALLLSNAVFKRLTTGGNTQRGLVNNVIFNNSTGDAAGSTGSHVITGIENYINFTGVNDSGVQLLGFDAEVNILGAGTNTFSDVYGSKVKLSTQGNATNNTISNSYGYYVSYDYDAIGSYNNTHLFYGNYNSDSQSTLTGERRGIWIVGATHSQLSGRLSVGSVDADNYEPTANQLVVYNDDNSSDAGITIVAGATTASSKIHFADGSNNSQEDVGRIIYDHSTNDLQIWNNNSQTMTINTTGLEILANNTGGGENNTLRFVDTDTTSVGNQQTGKIEFFTSDATQSGVHAYILGSTNDADGNGDLSFATGTAGSAEERLRITSSGNVGINLSSNVSGNATTTPWTNLHVVGANVADGVSSRNNSAPTGQLHVSSTGYGVNQGGTISLGSEADNVNPNAAYASISGRRVSALGYQYGGYLTLNVSDGSNVNEKVRITSSGNVGIGTNNPGAKLHIRTASGSDTPGSTTSHILFDLADDGGPGWVQRLWDSGAGSGGKDGSFAIDRRNGGVWSNVLTLKRSDGNVGIGTDDPNKKLHVEGDARVTGTLTVGTSTIIINGAHEYPTIRPTLDLNFAATKTLDRRVIFTRNSIGTYTDELGVVRYASNNVPRFDHDPATGESLGLLIEESRTNLIPYSEDFNNAAWTKRNITFTSNAATAPDGNTTADKIAPNSGTVYPADIYDSFTITTPLTLSLWAKADGFNVININLGNYGDNGVEDALLKVNVNTGALVENTGSSGGFWTSYSITPHSNGWYRITATTTDTTDGNAVVQFQVCEDDGSQTVTSGDGVKGILIWGAQLEAGAFPTSYIPTSGSTATRAADNAKITGTNFTDFYNFSEGTTVFEAQTKGAPSNSYYGEIGTYGVSSNRNIMYAVAGTSNAILFYASGGTTVVNSLSSTAPYETNTNRVSAFFYKENDFGVFASGDYSATDTSGSVLTNADQFSIGMNNQNNSEHLNGTIRRVSYYPKRLPNAQLQGLTAL